MCNLYTQTSSVEAIRRLFEQRQMPLDFPEGVPNLPPTDVRITDRGAIVQSSEGEAGYRLTVRRWSWPGPGGKPVFNFRSEGRRFGDGRCLIPADGFYEFTAPAEPGKKTKDRWRFTARGDDMLGVAGLVRSVPGLGETFTMLTCSPGPDVAPYHGRQVVVLSPADWKCWLDGADEQDLLRPAPAGTLAVSLA